MITQLDTLFIGYDSMSILLLIIIVYNKHFVCNIAYKKIKIVYQKYFSLFFFLNRRAYLIQYRLFLLREYHTSDHHNVNYESQRGSST